MAGKRKSSKSTTVVQQYNNCHYDYNCHCQCCFCCDYRDSLVCSAGTQLLPRSGALRMQKLKTRLLRTQSSKVLRLKPTVSQCMSFSCTAWCFCSLSCISQILQAQSFLSQPCTLRSAPRISSWLIFNFPVHSSAFSLSKPLPSFSCVSCGWHRFLCRLGERIRPPCSSLQTMEAGSREEWPRNKK